MTALGIDIGGTSVKVALMAGSHAQGVGRSFRYDKPDRTEVCRAIADAFQKASGSPGSVTTVGLCAPGLLAPTGDRVERSVNVPGLAGVPLQELVTEATRSSGRVLIVSDVHAAAHDLITSEGLSGRVWTLALGTGVGGIVLDDGVPLRVSGNSSGHIGQIDVSLDDDPPVPVGADGGRGGLEGYIGLRSLQARYGSNLGGFTGSAGQAPGRALIKAIRIGHAIYRPMHIRLVGGVALLMADHIQAIHEATLEGLTSLARPGWTLGVGQDLFHAARGAAKLASV